ncbi:MAG: heme-binding protein [Candidatus Pelagibacter bacterium]|jgi:DNA gyrase inhibitor GyrI|nr:heme-binding protein [Pelagibacterales bacterium]MBL6862873.1 heme-binding protein [Candidatus Pelagibacter bacterium]MDC1163378.1 heme-binding protein [Candidatus Pelagibacter sp.]|tara:strand:+ start:175 stop:723 length:549 start_codon:yes stop_codon:yes gene_type:complete
MKKILLVLTFILTLSSQLMAYEETNYEVVKENKIYEIRKYPNRLVIETNSVQGNGFRKLFNYISGNNKENEEIKMTVPVTQEIKNENMTMQFYLPSKFNKDNAPKPVDSEVKILTIEGGYYAVIEYSGRSSDKNFLKNKDILEKALKQDNLLVLSPPIRASYNSPFTLPILKRNEVMYRVDL